MYARLLEADSGAAVSGESIALMGRKSGSRVWEPIGSATTSSTGLARITLTPFVTLEVQAYYYGGDGLMGATAGPVITVMGRRASAAAVDTTLRSGDVMTVKGRVAPAVTSTVTLQRYYGGQWRSVLTRSTRSDGVFSFSRTVSGAGKQKFRAWVASKSPFAAGPSGDVWITVR